MTVNQSVSAGIAVSADCRVTRNYKRAYIVQGSRFDALLNQTSVTSRTEGLQGEEEKVRAACC